MSHPVQLGVYLRACSGVGLRASCELTWERRVKQARSVIKCDRECTESVLGSVLESVFRAYLGAYRQAGWECAIESNWERTVKQAGSVQSSTSGSLLSSLLNAV